MHGRASSIVVGALAALAMVGLADSTRAAEITGRYVLVDPGPDVPTYWAIVNIDEDGKVRDFVNASAGDYAIDHVYDPNNQGRILEVILRKSGSDANLLPEFLRTPQKATILDLNASGGVIGHYNGDARDPFYYNVETKEHFDLKTLPGTSQTRTTGVYGINDHGQIVGAVDGKAILYSSPGAVPVELMKLVTNGGQWNLISALGINNRGEIAGYGFQAGARFYKVEPQAVPEPSTIVVFGSVGLLGAWLSARGRRKR